MLIYFLKFFHVLIAVALMGGTFWCFTAKNINLFLASRILLFLSLLGVITGSFLVHPMHHTFQTAWIRSAYLLILCYIGGTLLLKFNFQYRWVNKTIFLFLIILVVLITHDAVTQSTWIRI